MDSKIRILHILPQGTVGGAENYVLSLCRYHDKKRFCVRVCILFSEGIMSERMKSCACEVIHLNMTSGFDILKVFSLVSIIRNRKIDIVDLHGQTPLAKMACILSGVPVIVHTDHGPVVQSPLKRRERVIFANRLLSPFFDRFIAISRCMSDSLVVREKIPTNKISLVYNGVDVDAIRQVVCDTESMKKALNLSPKIPVLGTVGRLAPEKQLPFLLEVLKILKKRGLPFVALIIGDGPERKAIEKHILNMGLDECVKILGQREDVYQLLDIINIFLVSSGGEAFSIAILEAMAKGKPIVAYNVKGVNEAIISGETGLLASVNNKEELANNIQLLLQCPQFANRLGQQAYKRTKKLFNIPQNVEQLESIFQTLLNKKVNTFNS